MSFNPKNLPIYEFAERTRLIEKLESNDVTILIGKTGSGKSSQLPQMIRDKILGSKILCSQPRRMATVSIAERVAAERNIKCGALEVGYHIGQNLHASNRDIPILFCTTGILLEKIRQVGAKVFKNRDYILIDEVHERSVETDLVLASLKQILVEGKRNHGRNILGKVVLMSATADAVTYEKYYSQNTGLQVTKITIDNLLEEGTYKIEKKYLEDCLVFAGLPIGTKQVFNPRGNLNIEMELVKFSIAKLIQNAQRDGDIPKDIIVFLPTYKSILKQYAKLNTLSKELEFSIIPLHSSLDAEHVMEQITKHKIEELQEPSIRKHRVYLATNIAESSVTIPDVGVVFDLCLTNNIKWNDTRKKTFSAVELVSKSQARQRMGRTGRTCAGRVYHFLPKAEFSTMLSAFEPPKLLMSSLREEVLMLVCSQNVNLQRPRNIMNTLLDKPSDHRVSEALEYLQEIGAIEKSTTTNSLFIQRHSAIDKENEHFRQTIFGAFLGCLPFDIETSKLLLNFLCLNLLPDGIVVASIKKFSNKPVALPKLEEEDIEHNERLENWSHLPSSTKNFTIISHLAAFICWRDVYLNLRRMKLCIDTVNLLPEEFDEDEDSDEASHGFLARVYGSDVQEWCEEYNLSFNALHSCLRTLYHTMLSLVKASITYVSQPKLSKQDLIADFLSNEAICAVRSAIGRFLVRHENSRESLYQFHHILNQKIETEKDKRPCAFFQSGSCRKISCKYSHDASLRREGAACAHWFLFEKCTKGSLCRFSHNPKSTFYGDSEKVELKLKDSLQVSCLKTNENFLEELFASHTAMVQVVNLFDDKPTDSNEIPCIVKEMKDKYDSTMQSSFEVAVFLAAETAYVQEFEEFPCANEYKTQFLDMPVVYSVGTPKNVFTHTTAFIKLSSGSNILVYWNITDERNMNGDYMFRFFSSLTGKLVERQVSATILLNCTYALLYDKQVIEIAETCFFTLVDFRPSFIDSDSDNLNKYLFKFKTNPTVNLRELKDTILSNG